MSYRTELMEKILSSEEAQKIITYVSPRYGESYVMLWLFQAIGFLLEESNSFPDEFRGEVTPATAKWTLDLWEREYGIVTNPSLTAEQRQRNIMTKIRHRYPTTPKKLKDIVSSLSGYEVELLENVSKNKFKIIIRGYLSDLTDVEEAIQESKPAHLIYEIMMAELFKVDMLMYSGMCVSEYESYNVEVSNS